MTDNDVLLEFEESGALMKGHFVLSSGLHSDTYLQCARVMMDARRGGRVCAALVSKVRRSLGDGIDLVVSPAMGGIVVGYEVGRQLVRPSIFLERVDGTFRLRRGFAIPPKARVLIVEDVVTTGLSLRESCTAIESEGGQVVAAACLVDRSEKNFDLGHPFFSLIDLHGLPLYAADQLPSWLARLPAVKLGSRVIPGI